MTEQAIQTQPEPQSYLSIIRSTLPNFLYISLTFLIDFGSTTYFVDAASGNNNSTAVTGLLLMAVYISSVPLVAIIFSGLDCIKKAENQKANQNYGPAMLTCTFLATGLGLISSAIGLFFHQKILDWMLSGKDDIKTSVKAALLSFLYCGGFFGYFFSAVGTILLASISRSHLDVPGNLLRLLFFIGLGVNNLLFTNDDGINKKLVGQTFAAGYWITVLTAWLTFTWLGLKNNFIQRQFPPILASLKEALYSFIAGLTSFISWLADMLSTFVVFGTLASIYLDEEAIAAIGVYDTIRTVIILITGTASNVAAISSAGPLCEKKDTVNFYRYHKVYLGYIFAASALITSILPFLANFFTKQFAPENTLTPDKLSWLVLSGMVTCTALNNAATGMSKGFGIRWPYAAIDTFFHLAFFCISIVLFMYSDNVTPLLLYSARFCTQFFNALFTNLFTFKLEPEELRNKAYKHNPLTFFCRPSNVEPAPEEPPRLITAPTNITTAL